MPTETAAPRMTMEKRVKKIKERADLALENRHYFEKLRKTAVEKTKGRRRTNNIYDPEYCAFWEGHNSGEWMGLTGQEQHNTSHGGFYNDPSVLEVLETMLKQIKKKKTLPHRLLKGKEHWEQELAHIHGKEYCIVIYQNMGKPPNKRTSKQVKRELADLDRLDKLTEKYTP
jgi:hypothetical protein